MLLLLLLLLFLLFLFFVVVVEFQTFIPMRLGVTNRFILCQGLLVLCAQKKRVIRLAALFVPKITCSCSLILLNVVSFLFRFH